MSDDLEALLILQAAGGAQAPRRALLDTYVTPAAALAAGASQWQRHGLNAQQTGALQAPDTTALARCRVWLQAPDHHLLGWHDPDYPALLRNIASPPLVLFVAGDPSLLWYPSVAVVGSRTPTAGGRDNAFDFARALAQSGLAVISGLAAGIDTAAHQGALAAKGRTLAVLGTGPNVPYPRTNAALLARIADQGAVLSEHPPGTAVRPQHFPSRNRILAGLSLGTVVIEAAARSGALITARQAGEAGREVFALPGSIHNPMARGCHRLIRDGAALVESAAEVLTTLGPLAAGLAQSLHIHLQAPSTETQTASTADPFTTSAPQHPDYHCLWLALGFDPTGMDQLVSRTGLTAAGLSSMLMLMELEGRVVVEHGRYSRKR